MCKIILLLIVSLSSTRIYSQTLLPLDLLRMQLQQRVPASYDSSKMYFQLFTKDGLHYLNPVYQLLLNREKMKVAMGERSFYDNASQWISFSGDYQTSNNLAITDDDTLTSKSKRDITNLINSYKEVKHVAAKNHILKKAEAYQIIMINEAHHNPSHRAFTFSILKDLYKKGFRYFAMETFSNYDPGGLNKVTAATGTYTLEPIGGELVRLALELGYQLLPYEDTAYHANHTSTQRDSVQASNLYKVLQKDSAAKIIVHAGFAHIMKTIMEDYIPLGKALYNLTGTPYLSIDQTAYSESTKGAFGRTLYNSHVQKYSIKRPVIALKKNSNHPMFDTTLYDYKVIHPHTRYKDQRPHWVSLNRERKKYVVKKDLITPNTFYVQAFYQKELQDSKIENLIPADQTYYKTNNGSYVLYLRKSKYTVVLRDAFYKVIKTIEIQVS